MGFNSAFKGLKNEVNYYFVVSLFFRDPSDDRWMAEPTNSFCHFYVHNKKKGQKNSIVLFTGKNVSKNENV